jgi:hypothetical protein
MTLLIWYRMTVPNLFKGRIDEADNPVHHAQVILIIGLQSHSAREWEKVYLNNALDMAKTWRARLQIH